MRMIALITVAFISTAQAKPEILYTLENEGIVTWQGKCHLYGEYYNCMLINHKADEYLVAGNMTENGLLVKYVIKGGRDSKVVWDHRWKEV